MNKTEETKRDRSDYVKQQVANSKNTYKTVRALAKKLFLSVPTIYRDLVK
ncbi:hypothetical protein IIC68_03305 [archaeon]|nr:hypothetical protein [archaeon]